MNVGLLQVTSINSDELIQESGYGLRYRTFNSFCHTNIKNFLVSSFPKRLASDSFWCISFSRVSLKFYHADSLKDRVR